MNFISRRFTVQRTILLSFATTVLLNGVFIPSSFQNPTMLIFPIVKSSNTEGKLVAVECLAMMRCIRLFVYLPKKT